jgi:hypothetical protein
VNRDKGSRVAGGPSFLRGVAACGVAARPVAGCVAPSAIPRSPLSCQGESIALSSP